MPTDTHFRFTQRPSGLGLLLTILRNSRSQGRNPDDALSLRASWHDIAIDGDHLHAFHTACGMNAESGIAILYPMTLAYPLILRMLSSHAAPMPLFRALNTRMLMQQYRPLHPHSRPSMEAAVTAVRGVPKGLELDLQARMLVDGLPAWECAMTFFYRGHPNRNAATPTSDIDLRVTQPRVDASWYLPAAGALRFGRLSGDTNPIHYGKFYAKAFGFERDFAQPLLVLGQALNRLPELPANSPQQLDARLKGPVYYERNLKMLGEHNANGVCFEVYCEPNPKPSICASFGVLE